jgi:bifunctional DNA-binding transcriptional regulator/antitoxin component of YhaV-PrlF toxin-antitoxin module
VTRVIDRGLVRAPCVAPKEFWRDGTETGLGGHTVIPAGFRKELGVKVGDQVIVDLKNGDLPVRWLGATVECAHALVRQYVPDSVSLAEELIEDRRRSYLAKPGSRRS